MKSTLTWQEIRDEFLNVVREYPSLSAQWREVYRMWILRADLLRPGAEGFAAASKTFKAASLKALKKLKKKSQFKEPWQLWLDLLRDHLESRGLGDPRSAKDTDPGPVMRDNFGEPGRYMDCGGPIYVSAREWNLMHESGQSLHLVRRGLLYTTGDEFEGDGFHLRRPDGRLALDGIIASVAETSASFCQYLETSEPESKASKRQKFINPYIAPTPRKPTLNALADRTGIGQSSLSRWYRGLSRLSSTNLELLANYLKVDKNTIPN
jgi:hypothetical protein